MKILVTGGNGFIGSNLIKKLLSEGHNVVSLDDLSTGLKEYEVEGCNYVYGDIENLLYQHFPHSILLPFCKNNKPKMFHDVFL